MPRAVTRTAQRSSKTKQQQRVQQNPPRLRPDPPNIEKVSAVEEPAAAATCTSSVVRVYSYETDAERATRMQQIQRRDAARGQRQRRTIAVSPTTAFTADDHTALLFSGCFCCQSLDHQLQLCPVISIMGKSSDGTERQPPSFLHAAAASPPLTAPSPCWNCGMTGHFKVNCTNPSIASGATTTTVGKGSGAQQTTSLLEPPTTFLDVTNILQSADPIRTYCDLLLNSVHHLQTTPVIENATSIPQTAAPIWSRKIWETALVNTKAEKQTAANWNGGRKSLYLVAYSQ